MIALKRQFLWLAFAVSALFNVFFLAGYLQARAGSDGETPARRVAEELGLNDAQTTLYRQLRAGMDQERAICEQGIALTRQGLLDELGRAEPDVDRLREIADREAELHRQRRMAGSRRFSEFVGMLSPEQRHRLSRHFGPRRGGKDRREALLRRFDSDSDGHLDEVEAANADEHFQQRRREHERRRAHALERFDADSDGALDEQERQEARRYFMQQNGDGRGDGRRRRRRPG